MNHKKEEQQSTIVMERKTMISKKTNREFRYNGIDNASYHGDEVEYIPRIFEIILELSKKP